MSDVASFQSNPSEVGSRWWTFTPPRTRLETFDLLPNSQKPEKKTFRDISLSWMPTSSSQREGGGLSRKDSGDANPHLSIPMPVQLPVPNTVAHTNTPGWDTPWTSRSAAQGPVRHSTREDSYELQDDHSSDSNKDQSPWSRRRKQLRSFILVNTYVPLVGDFPLFFSIVVTALQLFRFINIAFTTAALGMAIRIRNVEIQNNATGALGSSP